MSRAGLRVLAVDPGYHAGPLGMGFEEPGLEPDLGEEPRHVLGGRSLTGPEWSPGFDVSIRSRSRQMSTTSSCAVTGFAVIVLSSHSVLWLFGRTPGRALGAARPGATAARPLARRGSHGQIGRVAHFA